VLFERGGAAQTRVAGGVGALSGTAFLLCSSDERAEAKRGRKANMPGQHSLLSERVSGAWFFSEECGKD